VSAAALAVVALAAALVAAMFWRSQHRTVRRVLEVVERLGETTPARVTPEAAISRLERSVDRVRRHDDDTRLAEARLEQAFSEITQGAVVCDRLGAIVLRNAFARTFAEGRHGEALVEAAIQELLADALRGRRTERELDIHGPPRRSLFLHAAPIVSDGELLGAIAVVDDITEQQRIDSIRRDFVANVSHELKTPIGALSLLAETVAEEPDPQVVRRLSGRMRDESYRVSRIIDDLLTLSRIEGDDSPIPGDVTVAAIVADAVDRIRPTAEHRGVPVVVGGIDPGLLLSGDRPQLTSALFNLLDNAVKYSEPGSPVEVQVASHGDDVDITVRDRGIGIPHRDLERIFERFYRVDKARSRDTGGTGLGLAIVRHIVRNHGGEVKVVSREGEGSRFTMSLPGPGAGQAQ
jgi:two-component system, OmpR family, sensor histidine kinase SenX3